MNGNNIFFVTEKSSIVLIDFCYTEFPSHRFDFVEKNIYYPHAMNRTVEKNMDISLIEYEAKSPDIVRRNGGDWLAVTPKEARLRIGVTAASESEAREKFSWTVKRWIELLAETQ